MQLRDDVRFLPPAEDISQLDRSRDRIDVTVHSPGFRTLTQPYASVDEPMADT
jgi:hypothetical protein